MQRLPSEARASRWGLRRPPVPWPDVRLLVVEDEVDLAEALAKGLRREGYAVDVAHDARTALSNLAAITSVFSPRFNIRNRPRTRSSAVGSGKTR